MILDNVIFHFYKGWGVTPLTGPPNLNGFSSIIRGVKSLLTNVNKKMVFFNEGFPKDTQLLNNEFYTWTILYTAPYSAHIMNTHHCHYRDLCLGHQWAHRLSCRGSSCWDTPGSPPAAGCRGSCTGSSCSSSCCGSGSGSCYTQSPPGTAAACKQCFTMFIVC